MNEMSILVGADVVPSRSNSCFFERGKLDSIFDENLCSIWEKADARVFNLESPLYDGSSKIDKCGPHLVSSMACVHGLGVLQPDLILLANNHIMDHGESGLKSTIDALNSPKIAYVGVGSSLCEIDKASCLKIFLLRLEQKILIGIIYYLVEILSNVKRIQNY